MEVIFIIRICQILTVRMSPVRGLIFIAPDAVRGYNSVRQIGPQEPFIELNNYVALIDERRQASITCIWV